MFQRVPTGETDVDQFKFPKNSLVTKVVFTFKQDNPQNDGVVEFMTALGCVQGISFLICPYALVKLHQFKLGQINTNRILLA